MTFFHRNRLKLAAIGAALALCGGALSSQAAEWKLGHVAPPSMSWGAWTVKFADDVRQETNGDINITVFPSRQLGDNIALFESVQIGVVESAVSGVPQLSNYIPSYSAFQLPFLFNDFAHVERFFTGEYMKGRLKDVEALNMKGLAWMSTPNRNPVTRDGFVETPADLQGVKIRVEQNKLLEDVIKSLGANPVSISFGEVYTSMQSGVVDALVFDRLTTAAMKFNEVAGYMSEMGMYPFPGIMVVNLDLWNGLTEEQQTIIQTAADRAQAHFFDLARAEQAKFKGMLQEAGMKIKDVDPEPFRAATKPVVDKYVAEDPEIAEIVSEIRKAAE